MFIEPGVTTRCEVLLRLGEPDTCSDDERRFSYLWVHVYGIVVVVGAGTGGAGAGGGAAGGEVTGDDALFVTFDERGIVVSAEFGEPEVDRIVGEGRDRLRVD